MISSAILILVGSLAIGLIIGQFSNLLSDADKAKRKVNEKFDHLNAVLTALKVPEEVYIKCSQYYEELCKISFVRDPTIYELLSPSIVSNFCLQQTSEAIHAMKIVPKD